MHSQISISSVSTLVTDGVLALILINLYILYDSLSRFHHTTQIFETDYSDIFKKWTDVLSFLTLGYLSIYLYYNITTANRFLSVFFFIYLLYSIVYSIRHYSKNPLNKFRFTPLIILVTFLYLFYPSYYFVAYEALIEIANGVYTLVENNTLPFLAAFFSYLGWKYNSNDGRSDRENELSIHLQGKQVVSLQTVTNQTPPEYNVNQIQVEEYERIGYKLKRYIPFFGFKGRTIANIQQEKISEVTENECFSIASKLIYIHDIEKIGDNEVRITFRSAVPDVVRTALELWISHLHQTNNRNADRGDDKLQVGHKVPGKIEYIKPGNLISGLIYAGEIENIRKVKNSKNASVMFRNQNEHPGVGIFYHHDRGWVRSYDRNFWYLLDLIRGIPLEEKGELTPPPASAYKPSFRGARRLKEIYCDVSIKGSDNKTKDSVEYKSINIEVESKENEVGICHSIPVSGYDFERFSTPPVLSNRVSISSLSDEKIDELLKSELEAKYIITERHRISVAYSCTLNEEKYLVNVNYAPWGDVTIFDVYKEDHAADRGSGVIWKKTM